jgi:hypothetical protein
MALQRKGLRSGGVKDAPKARVQTAPRSSVNVNELAFSNTVDNLKAALSDSDDVSEELDNLLSHPGKDSHSVADPASAEQNQGVWLLSAYRSNSGGITRPLGERVSGNREGFEKLFNQPRAGGSASPIQRAAFASQGAIVTQEVSINKLVQSVDIKSIGLRISLNADAVEQGSRVSLKFTGGKISLFNGLINLPYPVPLRLLGREAEGYLDVEFLSSDGSLRVLRGSKGTIFVFQRPMDQKLSGSSQSSSTQ